LLSLENATRNMAIPSGAADMAQSAQVAAVSLGISLSKKRGKRAL
jgi:hypothetical protein